MEEGRQGAFCGCDAPGWAALDERIRAVYGDVAPAHYGSADHVSQGGVDPIEAISAYPVAEPIPHQHLVSFGMSELYGKSFLQAEISGFGFELTMRVADGDPAWAMSLMQTLAAYVYMTGRPFAPGQAMDTERPLAPGCDTRLRAVCFVEDATLGAVKTKNGFMQFLQIVGITADEHDAMLDWDAHGVVELIAARDPLLVTDLGRDSALADRATATQLRERMRREPSTQTGADAGDLRWEHHDGDALLTLTALHVKALRRGLLRRIPFALPFTLAGKERTLRLEPSDAVDLSRDGALALPPSFARALGELLRPERGLYRTPAVPGLAIVVEPTEIRDDEGRTVSVIG